MSEENEGTGRQVRYPGSQSGTTPEYAAQLIAKLGDRDPVSYLEELPGAVRAMVAGVDPQLLRTPEAPNKWSVKDVLVHLLDSEVVYGYRMRFIVAQPEGTIAGYDQERWLRALRYRDAQVDPALEALTALRHWNLTWIRTLNDDEKARWGTHSERGVENVGHIIRLLAAHDLAHRSQIKRILTAVSAL